MRTAFLVACTLLAGCNYVPRETFTIETVEGKRIQLTCPVVDSRRSEFTYIIDGHCVVEPSK